MFAYRHLVIFTACVAGFWSCNVAAKEKNTGPLPLESLQKGLWELRLNDQNNQSACIDDTKKIVSMRHNTQTCSVRILSADQSNILARYNCTNGSWGQTTLRIKSSSEARISAQGIENGLPFDYAGQLKWRGQCS